MSNPAEKFAQAAREHGAWIDDPAALDDPKVLAAEDALWITLVRARNAFLAAKDEREMSR